MYFWLVFAVWFKKILKFKNEAVFFSVFNKSEKQITCHQATTMDGMWNKKKNIYAGEGPVSNSSISKQSQIDKQCVNHKALNLGYNRAN